MSTIAERPFLTASWRDLLMLSWEVEPELLLPSVPDGLELDRFEGRVFASVVAFRFLDTRVKGFSIPLHRDFDEVNLRFYVRRRAPDGWRRGVVFLSELVPRAAIALVANTLYRENYRALRMRSELQLDLAPGERSVEFSWKRGGRWESVRGGGIGELDALPSGSLAEFIAEHYYGYSRKRDGTTLEYRVEHPRWRVAPVAETALDLDVEALYGAPFVPVLSRPPDSAFLAEGSRVSVLPAEEVPG